MNEVNAETTGAGVIRSGDLLPSREADGRQVTGLRRPSLPGRKIVWAWIVLKCTFVMLVFADPKRVSRIIEDYLESVATKSRSGPGNAELTGRPGPVQ